MHGSLCREVSSAIGDEVRDWIDEHEGQVETADATADVAACAVQLEAIRTLVPGESIHPDAVAAYMALIAVRSPLCDAAPSRAALQRSMLTIHPGNV